MKMNNKILISLGIVGSLLLFIILTNINWSCNPSPGPWRGEADEITISKTGSTVRLYKKDKKWVVGPEAYPADPALVEDAVKRLKELSVTDQISRKADYGRYDLTPDKSSVVTVKKGGETIRTFIFGKKGPTERHTFVRLGKKPGVYLAEGTFEIILDRTPGDFRDRQIVKVARDSVDLLEFSAGGQTFSIMKKRETPGASKKGAPPKASWICREQTALKIDAGRVESYLTGLDPLLASAFSEKGKETLGAPALKIRIASGKRETVLFFYAKDAGRIPVCSEPSPYVYLLDEFKAGRVMVKRAEDFQEKS